MWVFRRIKWKLYYIRNFIHNIVWYKDFLIIDQRWENDSIVTVLKLKLQKTVEYYAKGLDLPYEGWEADYEQIKKVYEIITRIEESNTHVEQELTRDELQMLNNEAFDILKQYRQWWD